MNLHLDLPEREAVDVLVAGGGIAGFCAAVAARRAGARVLLVEELGCLGGNGTSGGVGAFCGETLGQGAVFDEIVRRLERLEAIAAYRPYEEKEARQFDHQVLAYVLGEMAVEEGVEVLLFTQVVTAVRQGERLAGVVLANRSGLAMAPARVIVDATGEATVVHRARLPVQPADGLPLPMSVMFYMREVRQPESLPHPHPDPELENDPPMISRWPEPHGKLGVKVKLVGYDATDGDSLTQAELAGRRLAMRVANHLRMGGRHELHFDHFSGRVGIREGRRVLGDYTLTEQDVRAGRRFDDGIALGRFYLDFHDPATARRVNRFSRVDSQVPPYHVPLRCLLVQDAANVLAAGRCMSADRIALSSARVMTTCAMMGTAAGITAALAPKGEVRGVKPAKVVEAMKGGGAVL